MQENESTELYIDYSCSTKGCWSPKTGDRNRYGKCFICKGRFCDECLIEMEGEKYCIPCREEAGEDAEEEAEVCPGECGGKGCADCVPEMNNPDLG